MKKRWIGLAALVLATGIGTAGAYAASADGNTGAGKDFFERMLPFAKQMHPDLTDQQIERMYNSCRNGSGSSAGSRSMMNNAEWRGSMMNR